MIAHHIAVEFFGREYSPHGMVEHTVVVGGALLVLVLAGIGLVTAIRWIAKPRQRQFPQVAS